MMAGAARDALTRSGASTRDEILRTVVPFEAPVGVGRLPDQRDGDPGVTSVRRSSVRELPPTGRDVASGRSDGLPSTGRQQHPMPSFRSANLADTPGPGPLSSSCSTRGEAALDPAPQCSQPTARAIQMSLGPGAPTLQPGPRLKRTSAPLAAMRVSDARNQRRRRPAEPDATAVNRTPRSAYRAALTIDAVLLIGSA